MNKTAGIILGLVVVLAGGYLALGGDNDDAVMVKETPEQEAMEKKLPEETQVMMKDEVKTDLMKKEDTSMVNKGDTMMNGTYEVYSLEKVSWATANHDVVLFFRAGWCPTCRAVDADIKANISKIPTSLTILDVDHDNSTALKQKYGVTYQHTFVQVDKDGKLIKKWSGSPTLSALVREVK